MSNTEEELICIDEYIGADKSNFLFLKTGRYVLNTAQSITVPGGYIAEVHVKLGGMHPVSACTGKKLFRAIKGGRELLDRDFYVVFTNQAKKLPKKTWGVGRLLVKGSPLSYQVGANGTFDIAIEDHIRYINSFGEQSVGLFTVDRVTEHVIECIREYAGNIIVKLFEEVGSMVVNTDFLLDELNLRFEEFFVRRSLRELPGIKITNINVVSLLVREEDIQNARKLFAAQKPSVRRARVPRMGTARGTAPKAAPSAGAKPNGVK